MFSYIIRRILLAIPTLFGITLVTFSMIHLAPGDPVEMQIEGMAQRIPKEVIDAWRKEYNLDKPVIVQYGLWLKKIAHFDFGKSYIDHRPVFSRIVERIPATVMLNLADIIIFFSVGVPLGLLMAVKQKTLFDKASGTVLYMFWSLPSFWVGIILIIIFAVKLKWVPIGGIESLFIHEPTATERILDRLHHLILPAVTLALGGTAYLSRFARATLLEVIRQDYIRTAMAKGLSAKIVFFKHALRNSMIPIMTLFSNILPWLISGSIIIEIIFAWPGVGQLVYKSMLARDYPTIMGMSFLTASLVLVSILITDLTYAIVDPRVKYE